MFWSLKFEGRAPVNSDAPLYMAAALNEILHVRKISAGLVPAGDSEAGSTGLDGGGQGRTLDIHIDRNSSLVIEDQMLDLFNVIQ